MLRIQRVVLLVSAALALVAPAAGAGEPGSAGALFLRVGVGARASGMGEAFTAIAAICTIRAICTIADRWRHQ